MIDFSSCGLASRVGWLPDPLNSSFDDLRNQTAAEEYLQRPVGTEGRFTKLVKAVVELQRARWPQAWRDQVSEVTLVECFGYKPETLEVSMRQLASAMSMTILTEVEIPLSMKPVIACRTGKDPSCIDGQPYDPRYQNPDTSPRKSE